MSSKVCVCMCVCVCVCVCVCMERETERERERMVYHISQEHFYKLIILLPLEPKIF